jgi:hypothetical protein
LSNKTGITPTSLRRTERTPLDVLDRLDEEGTKARREAELHKKDAKDLPSANNCKLQARLNAIARLSFSFSQPSRLPHAFLPAANV